MNSPSTFEWDFSKQKKFIYSYSHIMTGENKMNKNSQASQRYMTEIGNLNVKVKENDLAELSFSDIEVKMISYDEIGNPKDTLFQNRPTNVIQGMKPDINFTNTGFDIILRMLLPLPEKSMEIGESVQVLMQMPFNANGSQLLAKGQNTLTFTGFTEINGINCAVLEGQLDISNLEIPEELDGEYSCFTKGNATYYFNIEKGYYVGVDFQMITEFIIDTEEENNQRDGIYMDAKNESTFKIRLEKIEE